MISAAEIADRVFWYVRRNYRTQREAAEAWGVSTAYVSAVTRGHKPPNEKMLTAIGCERVAFYREKEAA